MLNTFDLVLGIASNRDMRYIPFGKPNGYNDYATAGYSGVLIAGKNGSGKTQMATWLAMQLAIDGAQLIVCEFEASKKDDGFINRTRFLEEAFIYPPQTTAQGILGVIQYITQLRNERSERNTPEVPVVVIIDEFTNFVANLAAEMDKEVAKANTKILIEFLISINSMRKENIIVMIAGQTWGAMDGDTILPKIRKAFNNMVIMKLDSRDAASIYGAGEVIKQAPKLQSGYFIYEDEMFYCPSAIDNEDKEVAKAAIHNHWGYKQEAIHERNILWARAASEANVQEFSTGINDGEYLPRLSDDKSVITVPLTPNLVPQTADWTDSVKAYFLKALFERFAKVAEDKAEIIARLREEAWTKEDFKTMGFSFDNNLYARAGTLMTQKPRKGPSAVKTYWKGEKEYLDWLKGGSE